MISDKNQKGDFQRQMYQGEWKCSECGTTIKELPFEPDGTRPVYCRDCYSKRKRNRFRR